jgi:transcription elongation GreA/GreB family factor
LGKEPGATVTTKIGGNEETWTVLKIERWVEQN